MLTGVALAAARKGVRVYAAEPLGKRLSEAFAKGERVVDPTTADLPIRTIADAMPTQPLGATAWSLRHLVEPIVFSVGDDRLIAAMRAMATHQRQVVEPAGAVALAAILSPAFAEKQHRAAAAGRPIRRVAVIACGGNIDLAAWGRLVGLTPPPTSTVVNQKKCLSYV